MNTLWFTARGAGLSALLVLSVATALGALTSIKSAKPSTRVIVQYVHRSAAVLGLALIAIHVSTIVLDRKAHVGVAAVFVPFASAYRPGSVALGSIAAYTFALVAALEQGMGLGYQVDSSPVSLNGVTINNVEGEGCGVCNIAEALKRSLNTSYYRLMLKLNNGPADVADAAHRAGVATSFPGVEHTLSEDGQGGPPNNGVVLGQYQTRVIDMASAYATLADSGTYHKPHFVQKVVNALGEVLFDASEQDNSGERRIEKAVADNVTAAMQPIAGWSNGHNLANGRPSAAKTGTNQLSDTGANRDAWMVGFTPSLSTAVWVGTVDGTKPLVNSWGGQVYGSGIPAEIWTATMDGALKGTDIESFPKPAEVGGYVGVPAPPPPPAPSPSAAPPSETVIQPSIEVAPGITIPLGPPTTITNPPPGPLPPPAPPGAEPPVAPPPGGDAGATVPPPPPPP